MSVSASLMIRGITLSAVALSVFGSGLPATATALRPTSLGTLTLQPTSGAVDANPMLASATTSAPCPAGYGAGALLRVGRPGGPYSNIVRPGTAGNYDQEPFTMNSNRSMATSQGGRPTDGEYRIVVQCVSGTRGPYSERFETAIVVSGATWRVKPPAGASPRPSPAGGTEPGPSRPSRSSPVAATSSPAVSTSAPKGAATGSVIDSPAPATEAAERAVPGTPSPLWWVLGAIGAVAVAGPGSAMLIRRRRGMPS